MNIISLFKHIVKVIIGREILVFENKNKKDKEIIFYDDLDENKILTSNNVNVFNHLVAVEGVGFSGSSAVTDFLGEFSNCTSLGGVSLRENPARGVENSYEFDFLRDPGSLIDLERICCNNIGRLRDNAVHEFIRLCKRYKDNSIPFFDDYFYELSKKFIKNITDIAFNSSYEHVTYIPKRLTLDEYRKYAKDFLLSILRNIPSKDLLICDQLTAIGRPDNNIIKDYIGDCKIIWNYSDPRDVYARARLQPGNDWVPVNPEIFVQNWKTNNCPYFNYNDQNMLITNFDDFCNDYENQSKQIMNFLNLDEKDHIDKFKFFNPKESINNTQVWKKLENQEPVDYIFKNLKEFCYDVEKHHRYVI